MTRGVYPALPEQPPAPGMGVERPRTDWDARFLALAEHVAGWSKDPSTQTGAVLTDGKWVISLGFNGFPPRLFDKPGLLTDRAEKLKRTIHCEVNAVLRAGPASRGTTLYTWPFLSCAECAKLMIAAGVARVVAPQMPADKAERWAASMQTSEQLFREAGMRVTIV